jgi:hypothetical protein
MYSMYKTRGDAGGFATAATSAALQGVQGARDPCGDTAERVGACRLNANMLRSCVAA